MIPALRAQFKEFLVKNRLRREVLVSNAQASAQGNMPGILKSLEANIGRLGALITIPVPENLNDREKTYFASAYAEQVRVELKDGDLSGGFLVELKHSSDLWITW